MLFIIITILVALSETQSDPKFHVSQRNKLHDSNVTLNKSARILISFELSRIVLCPIAIINLMKRIRCLNITKLTDSY
jgi:hypothetical protein